MMNHPLTRDRTLDAIIRAALEAADPAEAVRRHVQRTGESLRVGDRAYDLRRFDEVVLIAAGKAAVPMAEAAADRLGDSLARGVVVTKYGHVDGRRQTTDDGR